MKTTMNYFIRFRHRHRPPKLIANETYMYLS